MNKKALKLLCVQAFGAAGGWQRVDGGTGAVAAGYGTVA